MKLLLNLTKIVSVFAILGLAAGCESTSTTNSAAVAKSQKEMMLTQAGFKAKTVTTPKQQQLLAKLQADKVSTVNYKGTTYYVFPTGKTNQILVGKKPQYQAYRNMMTAQAKPAKPAAAQGQGQATAQANNYGTSTPIEVDPNPRGVRVEEFDGFGPMDDGSHW